MASQLLLQQLLRHLRGLQPRRVQLQGEVPEYQPGWEGGHALHCLCLPQGGHEPQLQGDATTSPGQGDTTAGQLPHLQLLPALPAEGVWTAQQTGAYAWVDRTCFNEQ